MAWNFANWYVPLIEGCCHGVNVPVPYEDGMSFLESNEHIITIVNQLIDNNNEIPEIVKEECKDELVRYLDSAEGKQKIQDIIDEVGYLNKSGDTMTGDLTMSQNAAVSFQDNNTARSLITKKTSTSTQNIMGLSSTGKLNIYQLAQPATPYEAANKKYVDDKIAGLGNVLDFKGVKQTVAQLPATGNTVGDVWYVEATKSAWAWVKDAADPNGRWDEFGPVIDLSPYFKKADIVQTTGTNTTKVMSQDATTNAINANSYTLPIANETQLGGVIAPAKTINETEQVRIDAQGKMWVKPSGTSVNPSTTTPKMDGAATVGIETTYARGDHIHPKDTSKVDVEVGKGLSTNDYTTADKDKLAGIAVNANNYTLPAATANALGGVIKNGEKTVAETQPVVMDINGKQWVKRSIITNGDTIDSNIDTTLAVNTIWSINSKTDDNTLLSIYAGDVGDKQILYPKSNYINPVNYEIVNIEYAKTHLADKILDAPTATGQVPKYNGTKVIWDIPANYTLPVATADELGGVKADLTDEALPVIIGIDPSTHKLKGALMTAYESPTQIGGVVSNGIKTDEDTIPVHMDSDGKQWVKAGGSSTVPIATATTIGGILKNGDKIANETQPVVMDNDGKLWVKPSLVTLMTSDGLNSINTYFKNNERWTISTAVNGPSLIIIDFKYPVTSSKMLYQKSVIESENNGYEITNVTYVNKHLAGKPLDAPTTAGQIPKYNGTKVIWEAPAAAAPSAAQTGHIAVPANTTTVTISDTTYSYCIASIMGMSGNWIKDISKTSTGFTIEVNAAPTTANTCIVCYMLFN